MSEHEPIILNRGTEGEPCPIAKTLDVIATKWTFLIIRDLLIEGTMRFSDLLRSMDGISPKTLSLRLKDLESQDILKRTIYAEVPPRVEYTLTEKGRRLEGVFIELKRFGLTL
ncbi:winged helix-turn-helix transcriptional regulator [Paenibacillus wynnii]|uniref:winged helix-turn-helix transcriptional regulator n=1 Tax=Paenibacillus wynnii TaxID=268407 RepID=UPI00278FF85C|nr:helix-turn-helix domain-containing protein [Paenibacillus wynnii]MDQ0192435.1 DNA-binding HxlR family transcriptional regulator [Paenibacillus wynnii]